jgi:hypothetical protein
MAFYVPDRFQPNSGELAVLSILAVKADADWVVASGSLLTVPKEVADMSWKRWREGQPWTGRPRSQGSAVDLGPEFAEEPFDGVKAIRTVVAAATWPTLTKDIARGEISTPYPVPLQILPTNWTSTLFLASDGAGPTFHAVAGIGRPLTAVAGELEAPAPPPSEYVWSRSSKLGQPELLVGWPLELLGIDWPTGSDCPPPGRFVIGRAHCDGWIADVIPKHEDGDVAIHVGWDASLVDPLGCTVLVRTASESIPVFSRHVRISDLPRDSDASSPAGSLSATPPYRLPWRDRLLTVRMPRGPRRTEWGMALLAADGRVLDERPVARRVERASIDIRVGDSDEPATTVVVGDKQAAPSATEHDEAVQIAIQLEEQARETAAGRRLSTLGDLESYLRWRFSCRAGELLILDPYLLGRNREERLTPREEEVLTLLKTLDRPIRAMTGERPMTPALTRLAGSGIDARQIPGGKNALHDRVWIVGETALLVGTSVNSFLRSPSKAGGRATTASELPHADAKLWRERFEDWWSGT